MGRQGGFGAKVKIDTGSMEIVAFAETIGDLNLKAFIADMTGHDAPQGFTEKLKTGKFEIGSFDIKLTWDIAEATHVALSAALLGVAPVKMSWEDPAGDEPIEFMALIESIGRAVPQEGAYTGTVKVTPTGAPLGSGS